MKINTAQPVFTHEGAKGIITNPYETLKRTVLSCMLFENQFYESGQSIADRISQLCKQCTRTQILMVALDASERYHLRHVPLQLIIEALKIKTNEIDCILPIANVIERICRRPDQVTDLLALYWKAGRVPLANQLKKGIAKAFNSYDRYQLGKYNRDNPIKLRDALFLCHAKPKNDQQAQDWKDLVNKTLESPDTWEVRLSAGEDKKHSFESLLAGGKMGKLAILRNLRNMQAAKVSKELVANELISNPKPMLPFQYIAAARECPDWEDIIDPAMVASCELKEKLPGSTIILVDVSGSMDSLLSGKSKMTRMDAACGLAILLRECCSTIQIYSFSNAIAKIPPRQGMALRDSIVGSQSHAGTALGLAIKQVITNCVYDRLIVITDEQSNDVIPSIKCGKNYILNIASCENGVANRNQWTTISGFSEASIDYIRELENDVFHS